MKNKNYILYGIMILLYLIDFFFGLPYIVKYMIGVLAILAVVFSFKDAGILFKILGLLFLLNGLWLYIFADGTWIHLPTYMVSNLNLIALLLVLPFIQSILNVGGYTNYLNQLLQARANNLGELYKRSIYTSFILAMFINVSTLYLSHSVLSKTLAKQAAKIRDQFMSKTILRGVVIALALSPMEIIVAITVDITNTSYIMYLPWLLLIAVLVLTLEGLNSRRYSKHKLLDQVDQGEDPKVKRKLYLHIGMLFLVLFCFLICVYVVGEWLNISFLTSVTLVIIPFSFIWSCFLGRLREFAVQSYKDWKNNANGMQNFIVLFIPLGFFTMTLSETVFLNYIRMPFLNLVEYPLVVLIMIQFTFLIMSLVGLHAVAIIGIFSEILPPILEFINPISIGVVLITGAMSTATITPFGMMLNIVAGLTKQSPYRITKNNIFFALMFCAIGTLIGVIFLYF